MGLFALNYEATRMAALATVQAIVEFDLEGTILTANDNFLAMMGYDLDEIKGREHAIFLDPAYRDSPDYRQFWATLVCGNFRAGQYRRIGKGGREVWIQACYNPILGSGGKPSKIVAFANLITAQRREQPRHPHVPRMVDVELAGTGETSSHKIGAIARLTTGIADAAGRSRAAWRPVA